MENQIILKANPIAIGYRDKKSVKIVSENIKIELKKGKTDKDLMMVKNFIL